MALTHALLLKCGMRDVALPSLPGLTFTVRAWRALASPLLYVYLDPDPPLDVDEPARRHWEASLKASAPGTLHRLECRCDISGASAAADPSHHYVVETDAADGWWDEVVAWYDREHMPGLAAVPGCVRARRYINHDGGPRSFACYDLVAPETLQSPAWLAVRNTPWSSRVRPQFRNTLRTLFGAAARPRIGQWGMPSRR